MKVCIPSKNRAESLSTHLFFNPSDVTIFVEPDEVRRYKIMNPDYEIVDIGTCDMGVSRVRNFILDYYKDENIVLLDDDIISFGVRNKDFRYDEIFDTRSILDNFKNLLTQYDACSIPNPGYAYFINKSNNNSNRLLTNKVLINCIAMNVNKILSTEIKYDEELAELEDTDFTIQLALKNIKYVIDYNYSITASFRIAGGLEKSRGIRLHDNDANHRRGLEHLVQKYGFEFVKIVHDKNGYITHIIVDFKMIAKRRDIILFNLKKYNETKKNI